MRNTAKKLLALLLAVLMLIPFASITSAAGSSGTYTSASPSISDVGDILNAITYEEYRSKYESFGKGEGIISIDVADNKYVISGEESVIAPSYNHIEGDDDTVGGILVPSTGTISWSFTLDKAANYVVEIEYCQTGDKTNSIERIFYINGEVPFSEARSIVLSKVWTYDYTEIDGELSFEREELEDGTLGNDIRPNVIQSPKWITYAISDSNGFYAHPFEFFFKEGENTISLESQREPVVIKSITLRPAEELPSYQEYLDKLKQEGKDPSINKPSTNSTQTIHAEAPDYVSAVTMYPVNDRTSSLTNGLTGAQSHLYTKYNTAGKEKWQNIGEWMEYTIKGEDIKESGFYSIAVRYKQALLSGMYVSRRVYVNGEILFEEANNCRFPYTDKWDTIYLSDGSGVPFEFYFEAGKDYTIRLEVCLGEMASIVKDVSESLSNINECYLEILKLTGSTPDANRNYGFARVMPDVLNTMMLESVRLKKVYDTMVAESGKGEKTSTIEQVYILLQKMAEDENEIAANLGSLKSHIGSLGTWINSVKVQPLQVDEYTVQNSGQELPRGEANFFQSLWFEIKLFFASFVTDYSAIGNTEGGNEDHTIQVWVVTGRDQAQIIRNLVDNKFTPQSGDSPEERINVDLKLVSGGTLLPSVLAGVGPDVSLMESSTMIIDYALRNAVIPLNQFISTQENPEADVQLTEEEKENSILSAFPDAAMVPLTLYDYNSETGSTDEIIYGLPDSLTFSMMFYRKDVLSSLGLEIPQTWDDLLSILPILQYNNMEIGIQNDIYTFIYQNGYEAYKDNGMRINFDDVGVLNAFTTLCNMYTQYSLPYQFDFANRFRTGEMPIGIAAYTTCNQLEIFASELSGLWSFVPLPGYETTDENGNTIINNTSMATVTGCVMLKGCDNLEDSWTFMEWYTGAEFQENYSDEIVSIVGIAARPATANMEALYQLPWTAEEATNISAQIYKLDRNGEYVLDSNGKKIETLAAVPNNPGSYYLSRYISFAFLAAYNEGKDPADALLSYVPTINKEITRKRLEFGMEVYKDEDED